jgi:hypothetical protein
MIERPQGAGILSGAMKRLAIVIAVMALMAQAARADSGSRKPLRSADGKYQLSLGSGWTAVNFHIAAVQIGAADKHAGEYVEVVAEDPADYTDSLQQYAQAKRDTMAMSLDNPGMTTAELLKVNGVDAIRYQIHGQLPDSNVSVGYVLTVLKTKTHYIQVIAWSLESRFSKCRPDLEGLVTGFSENSPSK